jgi:hypothetical protein
VLRLCCANRVHTSAFDAYSTQIFSVTEWAPITRVPTTVLNLVTEHGDPNCCSKTFKAYICQNKKSNMSSFFGVPLTATRKKREPQTQAQRTSPCVVVLFLVSHKRNIKKKKKISRTHILFLTNTTATVLVNHQSTMPYEENSTTQMFLCWSSSNSRDTREHGIRIVFDRIRERKTEKNRRKQTAIGNTWDI